MGNNETTKVIGIGSIELKITSRKSITILNVHHMLNMSKNLVSSDLLNETRFKLVYRSNEFILSKNNIFVEKGYSCSGMIKLNKVFLLFIGLTLYVYSIVDYVI